jgi:hypothetical protein
VRFDRIADWFTASAVVYEEDSVWPDARVFRGRDAVVRRVIEYLDLVHIRRVTPGEVQTPEMWFSPRRPPAA